MYHNICFFVILLLAVISDLKDRRIPNCLTITGTIIALLYQASAAGCYGLWQGLQGWFAGVLLLLIPFCMGGMGAGDVKLLGMIGAFQGMTFTFSAFLWMSIWGGLIALILLAVKKGLPEMTALMFNRFSNTCSKITDLNTNTANISYPYGLAIVLGVLTSYIKGWCWL